MTGPFGFPDWQHQRPLDGPLLLDVNALASLQANIFGPVYVGRWARIGGDLFVTNQLAQWTFTWYADQAATKQLGQRIFITDPGIGAHLTFMLPNLGPWVTVSYGCANVLPTPVITTHLFGTNREQPVEVFSIGPQLGSRWPVTVLNGTANDWYLDGYHCGPANLHVEPTGDVLASFECIIDNAGTLRSLAGAKVLAGTLADIHCLMPASACKVRMSNTVGWGADLNVYWSVQQNWTGGS